MKRHPFLALCSILLVLSIPYSYSSERCSQVDSTQKSYLSPPSQWSLEPVLSSLQYVVNKVDTARTAIHIYPALSKFSENLKQEAELFCPELAEKIPQHVAIIMDGNRRYAQTKELYDKSYGHFFGAARLLQMTHIAERLGINQLTVYALSTENLKRPESSTAGLILS